MPLLTFDQFEAAVPALIDEAEAARAQLHASWRLGDHGLGDNGPLNPLGHAVRALAVIAPYVDWPLEPGPRYLGTGGRPDYNADVRDETVAAIAQLLEALAGVRTLLSAADAATSRGSLAGDIARRAFEIFAAPGGLPVEGLEWAHAIQDAGVAVASVSNPRLGPQIGPQIAHDRLADAAAHAVCVLALVDARRAHGAPA